MPSRPAQLIPPPSTTYPSHNTLQSPNIWTLMSYTPPRGPCVYKPPTSTSFLGLTSIPTCPCLRFMLNPVQAASSFMCDGCGHHGSFHEMRSLVDEECVREWGERERVGRVVEVREGEEVGTGTRGGGIATTASGPATARTTNLTTTLGHHRKPRDLAASPSWVSAINSSQSANASTTLTTAPSVDLTEQSPPRPDSSTSSSKLTSPSTTPSQPPPAKKLSTGRKRGYAGEE